MKWVIANYFRPETLTAANNRLIAYHQTIGLNRPCGAAKSRRPDGLRFVVPVRSVHAGVNPHYFGTGRGVTFYNCPPTSSPPRPPSSSTGTCATTSPSSTSARTFFAFGRKIALNLSVDCASDSWPRCPPDMPDAG